MWGDVEKFRGVKSNQTELYSLKIKNKLSASNLTSTWGAHSIKKTMIVALWREKQATGKQMDSRGLEIG